jgi:hypothetical protein
LKYLENTVFTKNTYFLGKKIREYVLYTYIDLFVCASTTASSLLQMKLLQECSSGFSAWFSVLGFSVLCSGIKWRTALCNHRRSPITGDQITLQLTIRVKVEEREVIRHSNANFVLYDLSVMKLSSTMKRGGAVVVTGAAVFKAINITINDDWDSVSYSIKKSLKETFVFDIMKDVKPNYQSQKVSQLPKVVILGTGWGAMSFLQNLDQDNLDITIVSPRSFFFYTPLLAGTAVGTVR